MKDQYRKEIERLNKYVKMKALLTDLNINSANYFSFMNGNDNRLSESALKTIIQALSERPINSKGE